MAILDSQGKPIKSNIQLDGKTFKTSYSSSFSNNYTENDPDFYYKMATEDVTISTALDFLKLSVVNQIKEYEHPDTKINDFINYVLSDFMVGNNSLYKSQQTIIWRALSQGQATTENIFNKIQSGDFAGYIGISELKFLNVNSVSPVRDKRGRLKGIKYIPTHTTLSPLEYTHYIHQLEKSNSNFYGIPQTKSAKNYYWSGINIFNFMEIYLERFGMPPKKGTLAEGIEPSSQTAKDFFNSLIAMRGNTSTVLPYGFDIELLETAAKSNNYLDVLRYIDKMKFRACLMPALLYEDGGAGGAYALSETNERIMYRSIDSIIRDFIEIVLINQIVRTLIMINFGGNIVSLGKFRYNDITTDKKGQQELLKNIIDIQGKYPDMPIVDTQADWVRHRLDFPIEVKTENHNQQKAKNEEGQVNKPIETPINQESNFEAANTGKHWRQLTEREKLLNFDQIDKDLNNSESKIMTDMGDTISVMTEDVIKQLNGKNFWKADDPSIIGSLNYKFQGTASGKVKGLQLLLKDYLLKVFDYGRKKAKSEIKTLKKHTPINFDMVSIGVQKIKPENAIRILKLRAYAAAGNIAKQVEYEITQELIKHLETGRTQQETIFSIQGRLDKYVDTSIVEPAKVSGARLATTIRTVTTGAFSQGRVLQYKEIPDFVQAYRYSAVLDPQTTYQCEHLDGKVFAATDPIWQEILPPNHFNCRSVIEPIPLYDLKNTKINEATETDVKNSLNLIKLAKF